MYVTHPSCEAYIDKIFIGIFWTEYQVGLYFGVQRIALFIGTMALAIEGMLLPAISNLHSNRKDKEITTLVHDAERYVAMVCIPLVAMTIVWSSEIILVFISKEFLSASNILKILALVALVRVLNRPWSVALRGSDRPDLTSILSIFSSILSIILMLILVPKRIPQLGLENLFGLGGEGAAYAVLISEILVGISLRILCYKYLNILPKAVIPNHYDISLDVDFDSFKFEGSEDIQIEILKPVSEIVLNSVDLEIINVSFLSDQDLDLSKPKITLNNEYLKAVYYLQTKILHYI